MDEEQKEKNCQVKLQTNMGDIVIGLNPQAAPVTVENFLGYVEEGFYGGTIFHRVIAGFMIQGGGFSEDMQNKESHPPIVNEASNGLKNDRGTISMARTSDPDSASSQFFISVVDNTSLDYTGPENPGYAVFGEVVEGMDIVDKIAAVKTTTVGHYNDVPVEAVVIEQAVLV
ncbi:peptidylprolyl isomerase [Planctomycetota bacterium]